MGPQENAELVRRGYAAFSTGDMATLNELFTEDAVWHVPGSGPMSGPKKGRGAILAYFGEIMTGTAGTAASPQWPAYAGAAGAASSAER